MQTVDQRPDKLFGAHLPLQTVLRHRQLGVQLDRRVQRAHHVGALQVGEHFLELWAHRRCTVNGLERTLWRLFADHTLRVLQEAFCLAGVCDQPQVLRELLLRALSTLLGRRALADVNFAGRSER